MIPRGDACYALANLDHAAGAFMTEHNRKDALRIGARQRECILMANPRMGDLYKHFAFLRRGDVEFDDF